MNSRITCGDKCAYTKPLKSKSVKTCKEVYEADVIVVGGGAAGQSQGDAGQNEKCPQVPGSRDGGGHCH